MMKLDLRSEVRDIPSFEMSRWIQAKCAENATERPAPTGTKSTVVSGPDDPVDISFVIPVRDTEAALIDLFQCVAAEVPRDKAFEVIFIDDGSRDRSWEVICIMARCEPAKVRGLRFANHAGHAAALSAGVWAARGAIIFSLGADLQNDPGEIRRFLNKLGEGYDVVSGRIKDRHDSRNTILPVRVFNHMIRGISRVYRRDDTSALNCWRSEVAKRLMFSGEPRITARVVTAIDGFHVAEIDVERRRRQLGLSRNGYKRSIGGFLDAVRAGFLKMGQTRSAHPLGANSAYQLAATTTLIAGAGLLAAMDSPTAARVAVLSAVLLRGPALLDSIRGLFGRVSVRGRPESDGKSLIVEDTEDARKRRKNKASRRSATRSHAEA